MRHLPWLNVEDRHVHDPLDSRRLGLVQGRNHGVSLDSHHPANLVWRECRNGNDNAIDAFQCTSDSIARLEIAFRELHGFRQDPACPRDATGEDSHGHTLGHEAANDVPAVVARAAEHEHSGRLSHTQVATGDPPSGYLGVAGFRPSRARLARDSGDRQRLFCL